MNKIFQILILIGFFITFAAFEIYQSTGNKVIKIITPSKLAIDFNRNNRADINELVCVENLETLTSDIKLDQRKIQNQLLLSNIDVIKFGYLTDKFAKDLTLNKKVKIKYNKNNSPKCKSATISIDNKDYKTMLDINGFSFKEGKPINKDKFKNNLKKAKNLELVIANPSSNKYHKLDCKYGLNSADYEILEIEDAKKLYENCHYCQKVNTELKNKNIQHTPPIKIYQTSINEELRLKNITFLVSDFSKNLTFDRNCKHLFCKETERFINSSEKSLDIAAYGWAEIPKISKAIENAKKRGVKIRVIYDKRNGREYYPETLKLINSINNTRSDENLNSKNLTSMLMHNKFIISDNNKILTGSMNFSTTGFSGFNANNIIIVTSPQIASLYTAEFEQMYSGKFHTQKNVNKTERTTTIDDSKISVYFSPQDKIIHKRIIPLINKAEKYIYIPTFVITHKELAQALFEAKERGVSIKVIADATSSGSTHSKNNELREAGISLKYENFAGKMHTKSIIIDDEIVITGSMNFSNSGENRNDENCLIIENKEIAKFYREYFEYLWAKIPNKWLKSTIRAESADSIGSCSDGLDNDYDGKIDLEDSACQ